MWLRSLEADRLRNLRAVSVPLDVGLTVFVGRNGQGKSSLLEAVYLLATGYSYRTRRIDDLVSWDGGPARVAGRVSSRRGELEIGVVMDEGERRLVADRLELDLEAFLGRLDVVALPTEGSRVLRDPPEARRRFLDGGIVGLDPSFLRVLGTYRRTLAERNALLRGIAAGGGGPRGRELDVWDERLVVAATDVHRGRRNYAARLAAALAEPERAILPEGDSLILRYAPSPAAARETEPEGYPRVLAASLADERERDSGLGFTGVGPHRDDLRVELSGTDLRRFGSAGQVRAAMVVLGLGKLGVLREDRGETPVFLMDDFDSDLDEPRARSLAAYLASGGFQAVLATAKERFADGLHVPVRKVRVESGRASAVSPG